MHAETKTLGVVWNVEDAAGEFYGSRDIWRKRLRSGARGREHVALVMKCSSGIKHEQEQHAAAQLDATNWEEPSEDNRCGANS